MKNLTAVIERNEDAYFAYLKSIDGCVAGGETYGEVKRNLEEILKLTIEEDEQLGSKLKNGYRIIFEVSLDTIFDLIPEINISQLAKLGGINPGLLRQYVSGTKKASEKQASKVMDSLDKLINKINSISLTA